MPNPQTIVALCDCPCDCTEVIYAGDHPRFSGWCLACQAEHHERLDIAFPIHQLHVHGIATSVQLDDLPGVGSFLLAAR